MRNKTITTKKVTGTGTLDSFIRIHGTYKLEGKDNLEAAIKPFPRGARIALAVSRPDSGDD